VTARSAGTASSQVMQNFLARSPPPGTAPFAPPGKDLDAATIKSVTSDASASKMEKVSNNIAILPSSLPGYHQIWWAQHKGKHIPQQPTDLAGSSRRLSTHRAFGAADALSKPEGFTPLQPEKPKPIRWQHGIRSHSDPMEALYCIYKALQKMRAEWSLPEDDDDDDPGDHNMGSSANVSDVGDSVQSLASKGSTTSSAVDRRARSEGKRSKVSKVPENPWLIQTRWRKKGMAPRSSELPSWLTDKKDSHDEPAQYLPETECFVHMDIQMYKLDREAKTHMVDFKLVGYERIVTDTEGNEYTFGRLLEGDKEVCSPFPFFDFAMDLILLLAETS
jgi:carbon catabolite-derepressing protein kinase